MWQPVNFTPPEAVKELGQNLAGSLDSFGASISQGAGNLAGLGLPRLPTPPDFAASLRSGANDMLGSSVKFLVVTPFQYGVGQRKGENAYLTPDAAIKTVLGRVSALSEVAGDIKAGSFGKSALVILLIAAPEAGQLAQALSDFNQVYPIKDLQKAQRRASALATLETDKFKIPPAPGYPAWQDAGPLQNATGQAVAKLASSQLAVAEGVQAASKAPQEVLSGFAAKLQAKAQEAQNKLMEIANGMIGGNSCWFGLYLEGPVLELARLAADFAPPLPELYKCCTVVAWTGPPEQVRYFKEAFGLSNPLEAIV